MSHSTSLQRLLTRQDTWQGCSRNSNANTVMTGHTPLDRLLQGGWPTASLTELIVQQPGIGELSLLMPVLTRYSLQSRLIVWLNPPYQPYAPELSRAGLPLHQLLIIKSKNYPEWLWTANQCISNGALLLAWPLQHSPNYAGLRKLQLSCAGSDCPSFLFRLPNTLGTPSPAPLRLKLNSQYQQLHITVHKLRGHPAGGQTYLATPTSLESQAPLFRLPTPSLSTQQFKVAPLPWVAELSQ